MATELGKAYVQIMPSAKGISGSIQKTINPEATAAGKSAGSNIASAMASSMSSAGKTLTKAITVPATAAATAVSGIVAAFGWKRLVAVDAAQAQLEGLGYSAEDVARISDGLRDAITGGMLTMAEATSAAATAMAAGVKEGDELTRYIQLLDSAVVGGTGTFTEMEQIFGRVVDQGKLTRTEFDMIAQRMPGFSAAVQDHMGVGSEAMYEMLRNGEITTDDFLDVMENFAGGMADAYADSWSGMVQNTLANVGIIGETILGGVFEQSKESIAEFLDFLRSDDLKSWAAETGQVIGDAFNRVIEVVKSAIEWWTNLDGSTQKMIMTVAGIAVAIGPVLLAITKVITVAATLVKGFAMLKTAAVVVGGAIGAISAPVLIAIGAITAIIAAGVALWKNWDTIKEKAIEIWTSLKDFILGLFENVKNIFSDALDWIDKKTGGKFKAITDTIRRYLQMAEDIIKRVVQFWKDTFSNALDFLKAVVTLDFQGMKDAISNQMGNIWSTIKDILGNIKSRFSSIFNGLRNIVSGAFSRVTGAIRSGMTKAFNTVKGFFSKFKNAGKNIVKSIADGIRGAIGTVTDAIGNVAQKVRDFLPFSPPKTGPLMDIMDVEWGKTIAGGIEKGEDEVTKAMDDILAFDLAKKATFNNANAGDFKNNNNEVIALLIELIEAVRENRDVFIDGEKVTDRINEVNSINATVGGYMD